MTVLSNWRSGCVKFKDEIYIRNFENEFGISKLNFCPVVIFVINCFRIKKCYASVIVEIYV